MKKVDLKDVPETMLWPLWNRAYETNLKDRLIVDPLSANLVNSIDYDFAGSFNKPNRGHGIRARVGDDLVSAYLSRNADNACVIALGEGLETQYWRLQQPNIPWFSVDVASAIAVRKRLLPETVHMHYLACSALDFSWMDNIPNNKVLFISAMGLLMYFQPDEVTRLLTAIAEKFPGAEIFFDAIPRYFSKTTLKGLQLTKTYRAPPMPWGININEIPKFIKSIPALELISVQTYAEPFPSAMRLYWLLSFIPPFKHRFAPSLVHVKVQEQ